MLNRPTLAPLPWTCKSFLIIEYIKFRKSPVINYIDDTVVESSQIPGPKYKAVPLDKIRQKTRKVGMIEYDRGLTNKIVKETFDKKNHQHTMQPTKAYIKAYEKNNYSFSPP